MRGHPWDAACPQPRVGALGAWGAVVEELTGWDCLQLWRSARGGSTCGCMEEQAQPRRSTCGACTHSCGGVHVPVLV